MTIGIKVKIISFVVANNTYFMLCPHPTPPTHPGHLDSTPNFDSTPM